MNLQREVIAGDVRDAIVELLHVQGEHRAAGRISLTPAGMLLRSKAAERRRKTPLLQPAFERHAAQIVRELKSMRERELEKEQERRP